MTDAFEEVEEDIRRERLMAFFKRYGIWILSALVAVLLGVAGWGWWQADQRQKAAALAQALQAAQEQAAGGDLAGASAAMAQAAERASGDQRALALMQRAEALLQSQDAAGALQSLEAAAQSAREPLLRDAAALKAAYIAADSEALPALEARVKPLIDARGPYASMARELLAMEAMKAGDAARARAEFEFLQFDLEAPETVRQRAQAALAMLGPEPQSEGAAAPAPESSAGEQPQ